MLKRASVMPLEKEDFYTLAHFLLKNEYFHESEFDIKNAKKY
jgi:hypothetical protein